MKKFGLIGYPLGHSFSKKYFTEKFNKENLPDCSYNNYPLEKLALFSDLIQNEKELHGLNITIPYKQEIIPYLDELDKEAELVGAVNCIKISRQSDDTVHLKGFNTDIFGFEIPLTKALTPEHTRALILGTGGASKAVAYILAKHRIDYRYVSRKPKNEKMYSYFDLTPEIIRENTIIVNTSPVGMYPKVDSCPDLPYEGITVNHILYDLVYNPEKTEFLKRGEGKGANTINGLPMLHLQAEKSWEIWNTD